MAPTLAYPLAVLIGYLLGSCNLAIFLSRRKGVDVRACGSGNPGASNTLTLLGWKAGVLVALHDIGKGVLAVLLAKLFFPAHVYAPEAAGVACVLGHIFPFYLRFRGGKGFASYLGMIAALNWRFALLMLLLIALVVLITDYIALATLATSISFPLYYAVASRFSVAALLCVVCVVIFVKHRDNLLRIWKGTEVGVRAAARGEHRVR